MTQHHTQTRGHHPHSPSSLQSSEACAHFVNEQRDSAASKAGTLQHQAAETRDLSVLEDQEQVAAVERALALEDSCIERLRYLASEHDLGEVEIVKEEYLPVCEFNREIVTGPDWEREWLGITGGYPDVVLKLKHIGIILDWKFGKHYVTPTAANLQGKAYAAGAFEKWPELEEITVIFFHPYLEVAEDGQVCPRDEYTHTFLREDRDRIELEIRTVIERKKIAQKDGLHSTQIKPTPKTDLCLWCANKALCPENGRLMVLGASKHKDIQVPDVFNPTLLTKPEDYAAAYRFANQFEIVAKAIKKRVTDAAVTEGVDVTGFEITRRRERTLGDSSQVKRVLIEGGFLTEDEFDDCANVPITKVEEKIKLKAGKGKGALRLREFEEALTEAGLLTVGDGYLYLRETKGEKKPAVDEKPLSI